MRNLKRALSLALASIMVLGMMVVGAGAVSFDDFSDGEKIVNKEAVATMVSLGVINGKDDGSYDPEGIVTRAEMAKLISVMLNGGKDPTLGSITAEFTDTKGHWAENYIAYVANLKIVDGRGDGTFGPNDQVTGAQAAKMLLTALGYRSEIEGFTGANWALNVQLKGNDIELFEGLAINPDEGLSRDNTAQMIYNAVQAEEVEYRNLDGNYNDVIYPTDKGTMLSNRFHVIKVEGVVEANDVFSVTGSPAAKGKTRLIDTNGSSKNSDGTTTDSYKGSYTLTVDNDMVGKRIVIYVKFQNDLSPNASASTVIGTPILSDKNTIVETTGKLKTDAKVKDALKGSGISIDTTSTDKTRAILVNEKETAAANAVLGTSTAGVWTVPGVKQTFIDHNNDGKVDYIIQVKAGLSKVTVYNTKDEKLTLSGLGSIDFVDIANADDVARDDYVLVAKYDDTYYLTKAETVTGKVTKYDSSNDKITVDGEAYAVGAGKNLAADLEDDLTAGDLTALVDGSYTLYLDAFNNVLAYTEDEAAVGNFAVVTASDGTAKTGFFSGKVKLLMADGTTGTYEVDLLASAKKWSSGVNTGSNSNKEYNMAAALEAGMVGTLVSYSLDGSTVTIGLPQITNSNRYGAGNRATSMVVKSSTSSYTIGANVMADNGTAFFIEDTNGDFTRVDGLSKLRSTGVTATESKVIYYKSGTANVAKAVYLKINELYATNADFVYVISTYAKSVEGSDTVYTYPVVFEDGTMGYLKSKTETGLKDGYAYAYTMGSNGYADFDTANTNAINDVVVTDTGKYAVAVTSAKNPGTSNDNYPVLGKASVWNVVDADAADKDTVWTTNMSVTDKVALVKDSDGNVRTAFVIDTIDSSNATAEPTSVALTAASGTLNSDKTVWTDASGALTLTMNLTTTQTVDLLVTVDDAETINLKDQLETLFDSGYTLYTATGATDGTVIRATVTIKETGKVSRTLNYTVTATAPIATAPTSVTLAGGTNAATVTGTTALVAGKSVDAIVANYVVGTADDVKLTVVAGTSSIGTMTLVDPDGKETTYLSGSDITIKGEGGAYTLKVPVTETGKLARTYEYTVNIAATQAKATTGTITLAAADSKGVTLASPATLTVTGPNAVTVTGYVTGTTDGIQFKTSAGTGTATLKVGNDPVESYTLDADRSIAGLNVGDTVTFVLTVTFTESGKSDVVETYTVDVTFNA